MASGNLDTTQAGRPEKELEGARERDFYKYYAPFKQIFLTEEEKTEARPLASSDKALAAFAQLGALRINARRCMISFFDRNSQYVLAEATRSLSLHTNQPLAKDDGLWMGACVVSRQSMLCERTLDIAEQRTGREGDRVHVMKHVTQDEWYKRNSAHINITPGLQFYAGMVIRSPEGYAIGIYSVFDDTPRHGLTEEETAFMEDTGKTVMSYLGMVRAKEEHARNSKMVMGLGAFVEGRAEIGDDDSPPGKLASAPSGTVVEESESTHGDLRSGACPPSKHVTSSSEPAPEAGDSNSSTRESSPQGSQPAKRLRNKSSKADLQSEMLSTNVSSTFSRAAKIIQNAIDVNGVIFFDASVGTYGGLVNNGSETVTSADMQYPERSSYFDMKKSPVLGFSIDDHDSLGKQPTTPHNVSITENYLHTLLKKFPQGKIFNLDPGEQHLKETHPHSPGQPDNFGQQIEPLEEGQPNEEARENLRRDREEQIRRIKDLLPRARSIAFMPLWDDHRNRWFAGGFVWSNQPIRLLHKDSELSFLRAFGNSIMSEVARLDTAMADRAKADLLNSISHELRSPLHGILGSIECVEQANLDTFHEGLVETIETCGRTLLDTIDHLLDFAKINNFARNAKKRKQGHDTQDADSQSNSASPMLNLNVNTQLSIITEEALETVFAGYESLALSSARKASVQNPRQQTPGESLHPGVQVVMDIEACENNGWFLETEAGAWRRLVMNLAGNAIKYTTQGFVRLRLEARELTAHKKGQKCTQVTLSVSDSGKGISKEYLNTRLFKPFAQEDTLHPGTGLGLSIVHQIVKNMGGEISVHSVLGKGTDVQVQVTMLHSSSPSDPDGQNTSIVEAAQRYKGSKAALVGMEPGSSFNLTVFQRSNSTEKSHERYSHQALRNLLRGWFDMDIDTVSSVQDVGDAAVVLMTADKFEELKEGLQSLQGKVVLVLCDDHSKARQGFADSESIRQSTVVEFIAQPFGPRKMARTLVACNERLGRLQEAKKRDSHANGGAKDEDLSQTLLHRDTELQACRDPLKQEIQKKSDSQAPTDKSSGSSSEAGNKNSVGKQLRLLLVDDNKINLQLLERYCKSQKHDYVTAENGVEAVHSFSEQPKRFDFICMDISMPKMDGLEATRRIRAFERANGIQSTKVIALTGLASAEAQQEAFSSGVDVFMTKPVRLKELGAILKGKAQS